MKGLIIGTRAQARNVLLIGVLAVLSFLALALAPPWVVSTASFTVVGFGVFLFALLLLVSTSPRGKPLNPAEKYLRIALVVWWSLLVSAQIFYRHTPEAQSFAGDFSKTAYGVAAFWALAFLALFLATPISQYLRQAFSGPNKWLSLFALVCLISSPFSPTPMYSLAWEFKLLLVVLLLLVCSTTMHVVDDIEAFFWANFCGFAILTIAPVARAFADPSKAFLGGRLNGVLTDPDVLSLSAATLVLLALVLNSVRKRAWLVGFGVFGATVMILSGGKTGIVAGITSITLFFVLQRRLAAGFGWLMGVLTLGILILLSTPLTAYFTTYMGQGQLSTLTGRVELWRTVWPDILRHVFVGHGYLASRSVSEHVEKVIPYAAHMHNGFIEALYNNGLVGLAVLAAMHLVIVRNLWRAIMGAVDRNARLLAMGSWAIYVNLLINGLTDASFGGHADAAFMLLLGLVVVSEALRRNAQPHALRRSIAPLRRKVLSHATGLRTQE